MNKSELKELREQEKSINLEAKKKKEEARQKIKDDRKLEARQKRTAKTDKEKVKKENKNISKTVLNILPFRYIKDDYFCLYDGQILDIFEIGGKSFFNATNEDISYQVDQLTYFYRQYKADLKLVALNYPTNTKKQQSYLEHKLKDPNLINFSHMLESKLNILKTLETKTTTREIYLMMFAKNTENYEALKLNIFSKAPFIIREMTMEKKQNIIFMLNNMNKEVKI